MSLGVRAFCGLALALLVLILLLFLPAGTLRFWQAWAFIAILFVPILCAYACLWKYDPELLERRLEQKEQVGEQKRLMRWGRPVFLAFLLLPGFDHRLGWSRTLLGATPPLWLTLLSQAVSLSGLLFAIWVVRVNRFAARTIRVESEQKVISTGPYAVVRHPMYAGGAFLWLFAPLAMGSYIALPAFALIVPLLVFRLLNEEKVLSEQLPGYREYCLRTRYRLIPFVW
jgi:protein-S-isoprenylcysteine O-methyltransferase Ste14